MAYEVTATRKRPQDFDRLVGQEFVVSTLENALKEGRIAHAYLFSGPRGVGKTSSARLLAKALNCEEGMSAHPCGVCSSCKEIASGTSVDVIEIDGASNTSVNDIRAIKEEVMFPPQASRYKIYIIDEVHMLSTSAFNALLKTIEEPPEYIIFIFATTELQKVPATIRSRCQQFRFQLIGQDLIMKCLQSASDDLGIKADEDALYWIAAQATGSMRDAYTLFDQVASFSEDHITLEKIRQRLNLAGFSKIAEIVRNAISDDVKESMEALSSLYESGVAAEQIVKDGAEFFRTLLLYKNGIRRQDLLSTPLADIPEDIVQALSKEQIESALKAFLTLYRDMRYTISPRFETELLISRLANLPRLVSPDLLVKKLEEMKKGIIEGKVVIKKKPQITAIVQTEEKAIEKKTDREEKKPLEEKKEAPVNDVQIDEISDEIPLESYEEPYDIYNEPEVFSKPMLTVVEIANKLKELGKGNISVQLNFVEELLDDGDSTITLKMKSRLAYSTIQGAKKDIESAITAITGEIKRVNFTFDAKQKEERVPSPKMQSLKTLFGGTIKYTEENTIVKDKEKRNEFQSIRNSQADGVFRSPDEEDEGGDY